MFIELFQNLGLSKNEAELYEALLELGEASVSKLNQKTNINRRNIYDVLNRMSEKGLVYTAIKSGENRFRPVDPRKLKELIEEKFSFTVIVNPVIANAFRTWFKYMWDMCPESPHEKNNWYPETAL